WPTEGRSRNWFASDLEAAGIPKLDKSGRRVTFHSFRHTFVTNLANAGVPPHTACKLARHACITTTLKIYAHTNYDLRAEAIDRLTAPGLIHVEQPDEPEPNPPADPVDVGVCSKQTLHP